MTVPTGNLKRGTGYIDLAYQARTAAKASDPQVRENARLHLVDGQVVAVQARYPGIRRGVLADLKTLDWLSVPVGDLRPGFDLAQYRAEITRNLDEELDYRFKARHQQIYGQYLSAEPG